MSAAFLDHLGSGPTNPYGSGYRLRPFLHDFRVVLQLWRDCNLLRWAQITGNLMIMLDPFHFALVDKYSAAFRTAVNQVGAAVSIVVRVESDLTLWASSIEATHVRKVLCGFDRDDFCRHLIQSNKAP